MTEAAYPPPEARDHLVAVDDGRGGRARVPGCTAVVDCDQRAFIEWSYRISSKREAEALGAALGLRLRFRQQVRVRGCLEHCPDDLRDAAIQAEEAAGDAA
jgi:hypothetical protein